MVEMKRIVVLGGGITGLSAAYYADQACKEKGISAQVTVIEANAEFGGKVRTLRKDGFVIEKGPDSFLARKMPIIDLSRELGIDDQFVTTDPQAKKTYILHKGRLHPIPPGLVLGIPTQIKPFLSSGLITLAGKARAALDLVIPRRQGKGDETIADFLKRRVGSEVLDNMAEPLLAGIYAGDTKTLSVQATFPQFHAMEDKYRSLMLGMLAGKKNAPETKGLPEPARKSMFLSYREGLSTLPETLVRRLTDEGVRLMPQTKVTGIRRKDEAVYMIETENGGTVDADVLIVTVPAYTAGAWLGEYVPAAKELTGQIPYVSVANVIMAFDEKDVPRVLDASGFVVPTKEKRFITACTWTSSKWKHTAPEGKVLLRLYVGRAGQEAWADMSDGEVTKRVRKELADLVGITAEPEFVELTRWNRAMPQYPVGHLERIARIRKEIATTLPGVWVTGSAFHGVGLPDCIRQGKEAAAAAADALAKAPAAATV